MDNKIPSTPEDVPFGDWNPFTVSSEPSGASSRRLDRRTAFKNPKKEIRKRKGMVAKRTSFTGNKDD